MLRSFAVLPLGAALAVLACSSVAAAPNFQVVDRIPLTGSVGWDYLTASPSTHQLFVTRGSFVSVIDTRTDKESGQIADTQGVHAVGVLPRLGLGFTSDGGAAEVSVFDLKSLAVKTTIPVGEGPDGLVADPSTDRAIAMDGRANELTIIDGRSLKVTGTVALDGRPEGYAVDGRGHVFTHIADKNEVAEVDEASATIVKEWPLAPGAGPSGMAIDQKRGLLFSACHNQTLAISDIASGKVIGSVPIGLGPDACEIDPKSGTVFVPCGQDGAVDIVQRNRAGSYVVVDRAATETGARTLAYDSGNNTLYTCTAAPVPSTDAAPAAAPGPWWRRRFAPNSFVVLVLKDRTRK